MTPFVRSSLSRISPAKAVLTLTFVFSQVPAQAAAPQVPSPPDNESGPVIVSTEKGKIPHKHREVKRGQVKPEVQLSKPQKLISTLR